MPEHWCVETSGYNNYCMTRDVTWADIKTCVINLSINCKKWGGEGEEFAPLNRHEGGFMCVEGPSVEGPRFQTNESDHRKLVRKVIRFKALKRGTDWPISMDDGSLLAKDDDVVLPMNIGAFYLEFEGQNCEPWTMHQCRGYADTIYETLEALPIHKNVAKKSR